LKRGGRGPARGPLPIIALFNVAPPEAVGG